MSTDAPNNDAPNNNAHSDSDIDHEHDARNEDLLPVAAKLNRVPDQLRDCEHCGITFLWSSEEQWSSTGPQTEATQTVHEKMRQGASTPPAQPRLCPGCRHLLPPPGRERGLVKWFSARKRYGFLIRYDAEEIFAHGSAIQGKARLHSGDLVEFGVEMTPRGPTATAITLLVKDAAGKETAGEHSPGKHQGRINN